MNETIRRFGYPATLIADYAHWVVLLRPAQPTLGSLILAAKSEALAFGELEPEAFAKLGEAVGTIETALHSAVGHDKLNYLMLMMVDPHVHFHVIPRYQGARGGGGLTIADAGWPKAPVLGDAVELAPAQIDAMAGWLRGIWSSPR